MKDKKKIKINIIFFLKTKGLLLFICFNFDLLIFYIQ